MQFLFAFPEITGSEVDMLDAGAPDEVSQALERAGYIPRGVPSFPREVRPPILPAAVLQGFIDLVRGWSGHGAYRPPPSFRRDRRCSRGWDDERQTRRHHRPVISSRVSSS
jgi:hypothetical protein